jgi:ABC-type transport system involved in cytochrome c biogenesis permease subunit
MNGYGRFLLPTAVALLAIGYLGFATAPPDDPPSGMHLNEFGRLPINDRGRTKPIDAAARTDLTLISGRQTFYDEQKHERSAVEWMLDALTAHLRQDGAGTPAWEHKVYRIENLEVLNLLGLPTRPGSYRYSIEEMQPKLKAFEDALHTAQDKKEQDLELTDKKVMELGDHLQIQLSLEEMNTPLLLDPEHPDKPRSLRDIAAAWKADASARVAKGEDVHQVVQTMPPFLMLLSAYADNDAPNFNKTLDAYHQELEAKLPSETYKAGLEADFNAFDPFYQCAVLYFGVLLLTSLSWVVTKYSKTLNWSAFVLAVITVLVHTGALIVRMYLMNRWGVFVTNLYGTAIFIGWVVALLGLVFEALNRNGLGNFVLSVAGFATMIIAQYLAMGEDTMEMMRAVLDTNFWLATHVTTVNVGYAGTMAAGLLGALFILRGVFTTSLSKEAVRSFGDVIYGAVCFATLFSFTGTVLGGIWADQSWGRFWGWDPKENGALLIVVWNALVLHARWGGLIKQRGMAVLTLLGNIIVIWSWWGVNMLGVGLHAYANADPAMLFWVLTFVGLFLAIAAVGMMPMHLWRSFRPENAEGPPAGAPAIPNGRSQPARGKTGVIPGPA